jgi:hypothetical protein
MISQPIVANVALVKFSVCGLALSFNRMISLTIPTFFLLNHLVRIIIRQVTIILCVKLYTMWRIST